MSEKRICPNCKSENDADYSFCKNCGFNLGVAQTEEQPNSTKPQQPVSENADNNTYYADYKLYPKGEIDGVSNDTVAEFVGTNNDSFVKKFFNMHLSHRKSGWNWPVFLFGFFLNIPFVWFFYRKMKKVGTILLAISLVFSVLNGIVLYKSVKTISDISTSYISEQGDDLMTYMDELYGDENFKDDFAEEKFDNAIDNSVYDYIKNMPAEYGIRFVVLTGLSSLLSILHLVYIILISIFANNIYKNHCIKTIKDNSENGDLSVLGGTANGLAIASGITFKIVFFIIYFVTSLSALSPLITLILNL